MDFQKIARAMTTKGPQTSRPSVSAYHPTPRDRIASALLGVIGDTYDNRKLARNLVGSSGIGGGAANPLGSLTDMTPVGLALQLDEAGRKMGSGHPIAGAFDAALAAVPIPMAVKGAAKMGAKKAVKRGADKVAEALVEKAPPIVAYHGSPHKFDQFDLSKIGTGEGAQAYGRGMYFAENEAVAKGYRNALTTDRLSAAQGEIDANGGDVARAIASLEEDLARFESLGAKDRRPSSMTVERKRRALDDLRSYSDSGAMNTGSIYQVGINADPEHFLDWDAPLSGQHPKVQEAAAAAGLPYKPDVFDPHGGAVYDQLGGEGAAEEALRAAGVPGIRYFDQGSRNASGWHITPPDETVSGKWMVKSRDYNSQGLHFDTEAEAQKALAERTAAQTRNYVVFDPKIIDIMKRYGVAAPVAASILAAQMQTAPPEDPLVDAIRQPQAAR